MNSPLQRGKRQKRQRDSSLVKGARRWGGGPLFATRRTKGVRKKKPGRFVRNDGWGGRTQPLQAGLNL